MKTDVEIPEQVPRKRRQLEGALDVWIAVWLAREDLTPSERRRLEQEKARRKARVVPVDLGFTGTRAGMTPAQRHTVRVLIEELQPKTVRHGDCVGADEQFHSLCRGAKVDEIVGHPPADSKLRAFCDVDRSEPAKDYLDRDKDIVRDCTLLIATPKESREPPPARGQGTWSTVRYARARGRTRRVVMPDGELLQED